VNRAFPISKYLEVSLTSEKQNFMLP